MSFPVVQSVIMKSIERNACKLYEARRQLLAAQGETVPIVIATGKYTAVQKPQAHLDVKEITLLRKNLQHTLM